MTPRPSSSSFFACLLNRSFAVGFIVTPFVRLASWKGRAYTLADRETNVIDGPTCLIGIEGRWFFQKHFTRITRGRPTVDFCRARQQNLLRSETPDSDGPRQRCRRTPANKEHREGSNSLASSRLGWRGGTESSAGHLMCREHVCEFAVQAGATRLDRGYCRVWTSQLTPAGASIEIAIAAAIGPDRR